MDNSTERLADGLWRIEVAPLTNAYLVANDGRGDADGLTLVDCGPRRSGGRLVRSIRLLGLHPAAVGHVVLTHWHADHMGAAARWAASSARPQVLAGRGDLAAVRGEQRRPQHVAAPGDVRRLDRLVGRLLAPGDAVPGATGLDDGSALAASGVAVVASPGHTAGHICLHLPRHGVLIAGDAVSTVGWPNRLPGPFRSARSSESATLQRLADLPFDVLAVGHGPPLVVDARRRLRELADRAAA